MFYETIHTREASLIAMRVDLSLMLDFSLQRRFGHVRTLIT